MDILSSMLMGQPLGLWLFFLTIVIGLLALDLGVLHRKAKAIGVRESLLMSGFYIAIALAFGAWVWATLGAQRGQEYFTGFLVEKTLSMDNVFVISLIFTYFAIPQQYQHRVLFWGILGVIVLRAIMIGLGATIVAQFSWVLYIFAIFLIATGIKMLLMKEKPHNIEDNPVLRFLRGRMTVTSQLHGEKFFVSQPHAVTGQPVRAATPLFLALVLVEVADLVFAVDSIPAIFAITTDPFVIYTSNIFAILGLRALYFALAAMVDRFVYLKQALALVLVFIGSKIFIADGLGLDKFPPVISLVITVGLIGGGVAYSLWRTRKVEGGRAVAPADPVIVTPPTSG